MRNFYRALAYSRPYSLRLGLSFAAAGCVGLLWFTNLSAIYPVLKIMLKDKKNLQTWAADEIKDYQKQATNPDKVRDIVNMHARIDSLTKQLQADPASPYLLAQRTTDSRALATAERELADASTKLWRMQQLNDLVIRHLPAGRFDTFLVISAAVFAGMVVKGFFEFWQDFLVGGVVSRSLLQLRNRFFQAAVHQAPRQVQEVGTGELMARVTNDAEQVGAGMKVLYGKVIVEPLKMIGCVVGACLISWQLTLLFVVLVVPAVFALARVSRKMKKATRRVLEQMSGLYKIVRETFDGIKVVKAFTNEAAERRRFRRATDDYFKRSMRVIKLDAITGPVVEVLGFAAVSIALLAGAYLVMEQQTHIFGVRMADKPMEIETLLTLYLFLGMIADPVRRLSSVYNKIQSGAAAADRIFALQDRLPGVPPNATGPSVPRHAESIEFRHVCFNYVPGQDPGTLNDISLRVRAGETIALVGPNGCGKSTLLGLLPRFADPDHGAVYVDGVNLRTANLRSLRKQIGLVTQDTVLFNDTIAFNIAYGRPGATAAEVEAAARKALAHEFIVDKPLGYQEPVGDAGSQLSGGQKQRIALARAILRDPRILILDEFTSQIDAESEGKIHQVLREFVRGRTTFLITHRMSTLDLADRIVVMDAGQVVATGTHAELYAGCGLYRRLYDAQGGGPDSLRLADDAA